MNKTRMFILAAVVLTAVLFAGCDGMTIGSNYDVVIVNQTTSFHADDINISDSTASTWGDDQMPSDTSLDPGETMTLEGVGPISTPESVDVRATDRIYNVELTGKGLDITKTIYITTSGIRN